jgi:hypothetical protein
MAEEPYPRITRFRLDNVPKRRLKPREPERKRDIIPDRGRYKLKRQRQSEDDRIR